MNTSHNSCLGVLSVKDENVNRQKGPQYFLELVNSDEMLKVSIIKLENG